jgi:hypothetical protein
MGLCGYHRLPVGSNLEAKIIVEVKDLYEGGKTEQKIRAIFRQKYGQTYEITVRRTIKQIPKTVRVCSRAEVLRKLTDRLKYNQDNKCWEFTKGLSGAGYGTLRMTLGNRVEVLAHRVSYILHNGPIPERLEVCHICDNPSCCNPTHLFLGTHGDNMQDKMRKGRARCRHPVNHWEIVESKTVPKIVELKSQGLKNASIAKALGIDHRTLNNYIDRFNLGLRPRALKQFTKDNPT